MSRKLVTLRKIDKIIPIPKKDRISIAVIGGWSCIVKNDEFDPGDLCVFFEIDSFLPDTEEFSFLGKPITHQGKLGHRLKTMKMAGAISQGLALPVHMFMMDSLDANELFETQQCIADSIGVTKYDVDLADNRTGTKTQVTGKPKGSFPSFIPKTDQPRLQNLPHYFEVHKNTLFEETFKLDGSSMTAYKTFTPSPWWKFWSSGSTHFGVCSRNLELKRPTDGDKPSNFWTAAIQSNLEADLPAGYAVQGEVLAPNIQGNYEKVNSVEYHIFSVYDISARDYLGPDAAATWVDLHLPRAQYVPTVNKATPIFSECTSFDDFQSRVTGPSINESQPISEGRVYKSMCGSVTFKCISNAYLLKSGK